MTSGDSTWIVNGNGHVSHLLHIRIDSCYSSGDSSLSMDFPLLCEKPYSMANGYLHEATAVSYTFQSYTNQRLYSLTAPVIGARHSTHTPTFCYGYL